jgi:ubiquinone/menaquinone biosynthesis C-methylase UbiE
MDHEEAGRHWNANAEAWTLLARAGYDVYRDYLNTPAFLAMLPDVRGLSGIDIGCGEGHNTRQLARLGACLSGIDIAETFIRCAKEMEQQEPLGIDYRVAGALDLPFPGAHFDFATAFMSLMDMPEIGRVLAEVYRVLKLGGFLQFSITHPCFDTPFHRNLRDERGVTYAFEIGGYFRNLEGEVSEWTFNTAPIELRQSLPKFRTPRFTHTLSQWLNLLLEVGFHIDRIEEPCPSDEAVRRCPAIQDAQVVPYFLHVRVRKPASAAGPV